LPFNEKHAKLKRIQKNKTKKAKQRKEKQRKKEKKGKKEKMSIFLSPKNAQKTLVAHLRARRLALGITQAGAAARSGVSLGTLRKFEQEGKISLESFVKLVMIFGDMQSVANSLKPVENSFSSIDQVINANKKQNQKTINRGRHL
jgi:DNA-binding transcriptional regulator YiaG